MELKAKALDLMSELERIEEEIARITDILESPGHGGIKGPLVDSQGFPRNDIDVYATRQYRSELVKLKTDWQLARKQMEETLHEIHAAEKVK